MKRLITACLIVLAGGALPGQQGSEPQGLELFLLIGQSNMAGRGKVEAEDSTPHPRVWAYDAANRWIPAVEPLHFDRPDRIGVGPGFSFGRAMAEALPQARIGLIPCAVGGTPLSRWQKGGDLYEAALARARAAMANGRLRGILWHQGEGDSQNEQSAGSYAQRIDRMIADLRRDLGVPEAPFVAGELGRFVLPERLPFAAEVNTALRELPGRVPRTGFVSSESLPDSGDSLHFSGGAQREFGRRYAAEMLRLLPRAR